MSETRHLERILEDLPEALRKEIASNVQDGLRRNRSLTLLGLGLMIGLPTLWLAAVWQHKGWPHWASLGIGGLLIL